MAKAAERRRSALLAQLDANRARLVEEMSEAGDLQDEIGIMRAVLVKLMVEVDDPVELANAAAKVAAATRGLLLTQRVVAGDAAGDLTDALTKVLAEMGLSE